MFLKRVTSAVVTGLAVLTAVVVTSAPASAATGKNGVVEVGEFGLYYASNFGFPVFDLFVSDANFSDDYFPGTAVRADNNTASYWNRDTFWWHVYTGANYTGSHGCLPSNYSGNASTTFRNTITSAKYLSTGC